MQELSLNIQQEIAASVDRVFSAWLNPAMLEKFMLPMASMPNPKAKTNPVEGGSFEILMQVDDRDVPHRGKYLEILKPNKLVFTWQSPASLEDSVVTILFKAINAERSKVELSQVKFIDEQRRDNHKVGWTRILETLNKLLG